MAEQLPSRMSGELQIITPDAVEVYDRASGPPRGERFDPSAHSPDDPTLSPVQRALVLFTALPPVLRGFLKSVSEDRLDDTTLGAFADWLEERGQTAEGQRVRLLRPQPGDVLILWPHATAGTADHMALDDAAMAMSRKLGLSALVMGRHDQRVEAIDPEQLRAAGWVRAEEAVERVRAERENCAELVERIGREIDGPGGLSAYQAASIRARGG